METCWLAREHQIPTPIRKYAARINRRYAKAIADGIVPTQEDMDNWIQTLGKNCRQTLPFTFSLEITPLQLEELALHESFDSYYKDIKPGKPAVVVGTKTRLNNTCIICLRSRHTKIRIEPCHCIFHRKCIEQWTAYSKQCPVCQVTINIKQSSTKCPNASATTPATPATPTAPTTPALA